MVEVFCKTDFTHSNKLIEKLFCDRAFEALDDETTKQFFMTLATSTYGENTRRLLSQKFKKFWETGVMSDNPEMIIENVFSWPPFARYLDLKCE